jgi:hypothetical protein
MQLCPVKCPLYQMKYFIRSYDKRYIFFYFVFISLFITRQNSISVFAREMYVRCNILNTRLYIINKFSINRRISFIYLKYNYHFLILVLFLFSSLDFSLN